MSKVVSLCEYRSKRKQAGYAGQSFDYCVIGDFTFSEAPDEVIKGYGEKVEECLELSKDYESTLMVCEVCLGDNFHIFYDSLDNTTTVCQDCGHRHLIF